MTIDTKVKLNNGIEMPLFGLGTYLTAHNGNARAAILNALEAGYRLFDTAKLYGNEGEIGAAIRTSGIPREEIFLTTKLWNSDHGYDSTIAAFEQSLNRLGLSFVDLYLIHWPVQGIRKESWKALETLYKKGKCRAVGVSNYMIWHLEELFEYSEIMPAVNQVEFHPYLYQKELLGFCRYHGIQLESYSPLTKGHKLHDPKLAGVATKYSKSPAQILIRWVLQKDVVVIPKSSGKERIFENANVFDFNIAPEDMDVLDSFHENLHTSWDPSTVP